MIAQVEQDGLEPLLIQHFGSAPNPKRSRIIGYFGENGEGLLGFIVCENLLYVGMPFVRDEAENGAVIIRQLIDHVQAKCEDEKASVISIASEPRFEKLLERHGMFKTAGSLWRKNFDEVT